MQSWAKRARRKKGRGRGGGEEETFKQYPKTSVDNVYDNYANSSYEVNVGEYKGRRQDRHCEMVKMVKVIIGVNGEVCNWFARGNIAVISKCRRKEKGEGGATRPRSALPFPATEVQGRYAYTEDRQTLQIRRPKKKQK